jgi:hypothetical protein
MTWLPTHSVPSGGMAVWASPDSSAHSILTIAERVELVVDQRQRDWALVRAESGWTGWVDGRRLVESQQAATHCLRCNAPLSADSKHCANCGASTSSPAEPPIVPLPLPVPVRVQAPQAPQPTQASPFGPPPTLAPATTSPVMPSSTVLAGVIRRPRVPIPVLLGSIGLVVVVAIVSVFGLGLGNTHSQVPAGATLCAAPQTRCFSSTGSMLMAWDLFTATRLQDGRVLLAGGRANNAAVASAEIYDPKTGAFSSTGSLNTAREDPTATLLADGQVLIAGGSGGNMSSYTFLASAELYDPKTGTFSETGSMTEGSEGHTATLLSDGRVLIAGGYNLSLSGSGQMLASAELYDPQTGTFSPTGSMMAARDSHTATLLRDGRVLIAGGDEPGPRHNLASAELYDPQTGTFSPTGSLATARDAHTATLLPDGRVLIVGGGNHDEQAFASAELYDPSAGSFSPTGSLGCARYNHTATLLTNGQVLIAAGEGAVVSGPVPGCASAELYDPTTGGFSSIGSNIEAYQPTATLLADGRVLIIGGGGATAELYLP